MHGDYRLDNCMIDDDGNVVAVLDWEICTLGDPLADVGLLMVYWTGPDDEDSAWLGSSSDRCPRLPRPRRAAGALRRGVGPRSVSGIDFYIAFAFWKLACILDGVYARYVGGATGLDHDPALVDGFKLQVDAVRGARRATGRDACDDRSVHVDRESRSCRRRLLVVMLNGWIDAGLGAASAMEVLLNESAARHHRSSSTVTPSSTTAPAGPIMELRDGVNSKMIWPEIELRPAGTSPVTTCCCCTGHEPDNSWRAVLPMPPSTLALELGARMMRRASAPTRTPRPTPARPACRSRPARPN